MIGDERYLAVAEEQGVTILDIDNAQIANPTVGNKGIQKYIKLSVSNEGNQPAFAGLSTSGYLKIWGES